MMKIRKENFKSIEELRNKYLKSLTEFQELFLEFMVLESSYFLIKESENIVGYFIVNSENTLIEFYILDEYMVYSPKYFDFVLKELSIKNIYCKSFDSLLLNSCLMQKLNYSLLGALYRDYNDLGVVLNKDIDLRKVSEADIEFLLNIGNGSGIEELFETKEQLTSFVESKAVYLFFIKNEVIGCGMILKVHESYNYYDIGVWVDIKHRKKGYGVQIINYLRNYCIKNNWIGTCGCAINNIASQKTLERSGFISKHKIIKFNVKI